MAALHSGGRDLKAKLWMQSSKVQARVPPDAIRHCDRRGIRGPATAPFGCDPWGWSFSEPPSSGSPTSGEPRQGALGATRIRTQVTGARITQARRPSKGLPLGRQFGSEPPNPFRCAPVHKHSAVRTPRKQAQTSHGPRLSAAYPGASPDPGLLGPGLLGPGLPPCPCFAVSRLRPGSARLRASR